MTHSSRTPFESRAAEASFASTALPAQRLAFLPGALIGWLAIFVAGGLLETAIASAQVHSSSSENRSPGDPISDPGGPAEGWSARAGIGFTDSPTTFLVNLEVPYAFNEWIAVGPMFQLGLDDDYTIAAPTLNVTVKYPDLPGRALERVLPYAFAGLGFAVIDEDNARGDNTSTGFLIDAGVGVEYQLSDRVFIGTQMMFDFLPKQTQGQHFIYAWQVGGLRYAF
jgi:hypothetical protein